MRQLRTWGLKWGELRQDVYWECRLIFIIYLFGYLRGGAVRHVPAFQHIFIKETINLHRCAIEIVDNIFFLSHINIIWLCYKPINSNKESIFLFWAGNTISFDIQITSVFLDWHAYHPNESIYFSPNVNQFVILLIRRGRKVAFWAKNHFILRDSTYSGDKFTFLSDEHAIENWWLSREQHLLIKSTHGKRIPFIYQWRIASIWYPYQLRVMLQPNIKFLTFSTTHGRHLCTLIPIISVNKHWNAFAGKKTSISLTISWHDDSHIFI